MRWSDTRTLGGVGRAAVVLAGLTGAGAGKRSASETALVRCSAQAQELGKRWDVNGRPTGG